MRTDMTTTQFMLPADAAKLIRNAKGVEFALHLRVRAYVKAGVEHHVSRDDASTWLDLSRRQASAAMERLARDKNTAGQYVRIHVSDKTVWLG